MARMSSFGPSARHRRTRSYWSLRHGQAPEGGLLAVSTMFESFMSELHNQGYLAEWFGESCVDGDREGRAGQNIPGFIYRKTRHANIWPVSERFGTWDDATLYTAIEFFHDYVSKPMSSYYHDFASCGNHYGDFERAPGQREYRTEVNEILRHAGAELEINDSGEVIRRAPLGLETMYAAEFVPIADNDYDAIARHAIEIFRARSSSVQDRRDAVRALADALEELRPRVEAALNTKDEQDLYRLVNAFGIRHRRADQKTNYDQSIFLSWMFNYLLSALHASTRLISRAAPHDHDSTSHE